MNSPHTYPRRPWFAGLLSALMPGLGHIYAGAINRGIVFFGIFVFLAVFSGAFISLYLPNNWFIPASLVSMGLTLALYFYLLINAAHTASVNSDRPFRSWESVLFYPALVAVGWFLVMLPTTQYVRSHLMEAFTVPSRSMVPTILPGDLLIADKRVHCRQCSNDIKRGEIITFIFPNDRRLRYIKRVIGLPGDKVSLRHQRLFINGKPLQHFGHGKAASEHNGRINYPVQWEPNDDDAGEWLVPQGHLFMMGDNRSHSLDSRKFGAIPLRDVVGKAKRIWFSYHEDSGFRWSRVGEILK